ncbi:MAG: haloacid dehalogenase-like hydrolase [Polyangiaceae bacterium]|nr:haloacid dehalogenase-like hydrolase [Polyangiaceae bacterium]
MSAPRVTVEEVVAELDGRDPGEWILATDADGTLWRGDVGEDVWRDAALGGRCDDAAAPRSRELAREAGLDTSGDASALSARLLDAYERGVVGDLTAFEAAAIALAGRTEQEAARQIDEALERAELGRRARPELRAVLDAARARGLDVVVVTASARLVVERALAVAGLRRSAIAGIELASRGGVLCAALAAPIPYRSGKVARLRTMAGGRRVLAAFGDSAFDAELLGAARLPVAVAPRPGLLDAGVPGLRELCLARR